MMSQFESPIIPTVGRVVLVRGVLISLTEPNREYPALITGVHDQDTIDLVAFMERGTMFAKRVLYNGDGSETSIAWSWMDYQKKVAAEQAEKVEAMGASDSYRDDNRRRDALAYAVEVAGKSKDAGHVLTTAREFLHFLEGDKESEFTPKSEKKPGATASVEEPTLYQQALVEHEELEQKRIRLEQFINCPAFDILSPEHQDLLRLQFSHMSWYSGILDRRLHLLESEDAALLKGSEPTTK